MTETAHRDFVRHVILPLAALIALLLAGAAGGMAWTARYQTAVAIGEQVRLAEGAIEVHGDHLAKGAYDYGHWDEAVVAIVDAFDFAWVDANYGAAGEQSYGVDLAFVIDADDRTVYSRVAGVGGAVDAFELLDAGGAELVERWRAGPATGRLSGLVEAGGRPAVMAIAPLFPFDDTERDPYTGHGVIFVDFIDEVMLAELARIYLLPGLRLAGADEPGTDYRASVPLVGRSGEAARLLVWEPARPGDVLVQRAAPVLAVIALAFLALTALVLRHAARSAHLIRESEARAMHDALTGLPNRLLLHDRLEQVVSGISKRVHGVAVLFLDLDGFKQVNDRLGHGAGDELLREVATRLRRCVDDVDTVARFGGDEFAVILPGETDPVRIGRKAAAILAAVAEPFDIAAGPATVAVSIGVAIAPPDGVTAAELLAKADAALYRAKAGGRGQVRFFGDGAAAGASTTVAVGRALRGAS